VAGDAAEVLPVSLDCLLPLRSTHPPTLIVCCFLVFAEMGATNTASRRLKINLFVFENWVGKSHFGAILILHSQPFAATYIHANKAGP
jgi:hypothetical protein